MAHKRFHDAFHKEHVGAMLRLVIWVNWLSSLMVRSGLGLDIQVLVWNDISSPWVVPWAL